MLSAVEILELEKKVFRYRLKRQLRFYGLTSLIICCFGILFYFSSLDLKDILHVKKEIAAEQLLEVNTTTQQTLVVEENTTQNAEPPLEGIKENTLILASPKVILTKESHFEAPSKEVQKNSTKELKENKPEIFFYRSAEEKIDTSVLTPPTFELEKPKGLIKIESQETHSIPQLKEKFEKTQNIVFALMLAEEFYQAKNYKESLKWALMANQSDPENEKSWIWFAKSKVKLGEKEDAITALKAYLKHNKSRAAQTLLNQINLGELNE